MFVAWFSSEFWRTNLDDVPCTAEEMEKAADGAFVIGFYYFSPLVERGIAGVTGMYLYIIQITCILHCPVTVKHNFGT